MVILLALLAACLAGCAGSRKPATTTPRVVSPPAGPGVTMADLAEAMEAARRIGGDPRRIEVLNIALKELGKKYELGGDGPDTWDCSGLVKHSFAMVGVKLPRYTFDQVEAGRLINVRNALPGDLLFFYKNGHVGIYIANGLMLHAHLGSVIVEPVAKYYRLFSAARRVILQPVASDTGFNSVPVPGSLSQGMNSLGLLVCGGGRMFFRVYEGKVVE
jgi:cell wall-associated NlpC family hydrolase